MTNAASRNPRTPSAAAPAAPRVRRLRVEHETRYDHDEDVELAHHLAHLRPRETPWQRVHDWRLEIDPPPQCDPVPPPNGAQRAAGSAAGGADAVPPGTARDRDVPGSAPPGVRMSLDCWGNWRTVFSHATVHRQFRVRSAFVAELEPRAACRLDASPAWEQVAGLLRYRPGKLHEPASEFALPSVYAPRDTALAAFGREAFSPGTPLLQGAHALMLLVHRSFEYRPASTAVGTRAPEALALRRGVCQDYAHVMVGAMRSLGLAARYVSGYLLTRPPPGKQRLVGADATHAWVDAWCPVHGWVALDPTNAMPAGLDHVTVAWGRDYADVAPLRGVIRGGGQVLPRVAVTVEPLR